MFLLLLALPLAAAEPSYPAGVEAAISAPAISYLVHSLVPSLIAKVGTITIPDVSGSQDGFEYQLTSIECHGLTVGGEGVALAPPSSLDISLSGVALTCSADWSFKLHVWPHKPSGSGSADVSVSSTSLAVGVTFGAASLHPTISSNSASIDIGSVDITLHGSALDWLLDLFKKELEGAIRSALAKALPPVVEGFVDTDGNTFLAALPIAVPIPARAPYNISEARFGFVAPPLTAGGALGLAVQGDVAPLNSAAVPPVPPPALPPPSAGDGGFMVVGRFSPYTLLSAAWTYLSAGLCAWPIPSRSVPLGFNSTAAYGLIAPGLPKAYPGGAVSLQLALAALPLLTIAPGGISASAPLTMGFVVAPAGGAGAPVLAFTLNATTALSLAVAVAPSPAAAGALVFSGTLAYLSATLALAGSEVGPVSVGLLQGLADVVLPLIVASVNAELQRGFPLPPIPGVAFTNATQLALFDGFAQMDANFTFAPPS